MTQRQEARDAKDRVKELNLGEVAVGLTQDDEGLWSIAVRASRELTSTERQRIADAAGEVTVDYAKVSPAPREGAAFLRRGDYVYRLAKSARGYLLQEMGMLHDSAAYRWKEGRKQLMAMELEEFLEGLHEARSWINDQLDHLIEMTEEVLK